MQNIHKIAVIGSTGKSGTYLLTQLLKLAIPLKLLIRNPEKFTAQHPLVEIITGDIADYQTVKALIKDCQAVISTLGLGLPPGEPTIFSKATSHIIRAMQAYQVRRYIVTTGLHVDTPSDNKSDTVKAATAWMYAHYPLSAANRQKEYDLLVNSHLDWTLVRLPVIELTNDRYPVRTSLQDCPGNKISAADLAFFLVNQLTDHTYIQQAPFIANV